MKTRLIITVAAVQLFTFINAFACTTFVLKDSNQIVYGRSFDFDFGTGYIVNNHRGTVKYGYVNEANPMKWISKYGSITFNQFGKEFPYGGMNEKGLVVAQMYLDKTRYPDADNRKSINPLQWIQYQLDVSSTVQEVLASDTVLRISNIMPVGIHFQVCDSKGNMATVEFLDGKMVYHTGKDLPIPLLTNNTYDESISYLKQFDVMGGEKTIPYNNIDDIEWTNDNILAVNKVFATAANAMVNGQDSLGLVDKAFDVLKSVTIRNHTKWSTVFDVTNKKIHFKNESRKEIVSLDFKAFDYAPGQKSLVLDIQTATADNVMNQFVDYSLEINREYVFKAFVPMMEDGFIPVMLTDEAIETHARFPETLKREE